MKPLNMQKIIISLEFVFYNGQEIIYKTITGSEAIKKGGIIPMLQS